MGDNQARLEDIGQGRVEAMDAAGIDVSVLWVVTAPSSPAATPRHCSAWPDRTCLRNPPPAIAAGSIYTAGGAARPTRQPQDDGDDGRGDRPRPRSAQNAG